MNLEIDIEIRRKAFTLQVSAHLTQPVTGLFGPSGSGKSSLLAALCGLDRSARGRIVLDGCVLQDSSSRRFVKPRHRRIGVCFQDERLFPHMSVRRNLLYGASWPRSGQGKLGLKQVADLLAIGHLLPRRPDKLSGGERRRVALGRALLSGPRLLLLDEPLTGLDMGLRGRILPFLGKIHRTLGLPILLVSHELMDVLELTDHLMVLREGQLLGTGRLIDLVRDPGILPLLHRMGLQNVLHLEVVGQDRTDEVTICRPAGSQGPWEAPTGRIFLPLLDASAGERISVSLPARSITLGLLPADDLSIQNRLSARIVELIRAPGRCVCILETAGQKLLAEVTLRAVRELSLRPGQWIWCLFKSHSLRLLPA